MSACERCGLAVELCPCDELVAGVQAEGYRLEARGLEADGDYLDELLDERLFDLLTDGCGCE